MKIILYTIGKPHETYVKQGIEDFTNRILKYYPIEWKILPAAKQTVNTTEKDVKKQESITVLNALHKDDYLILLDERGKQMNSVQLATFIETRTNNSIKQLIFLIGGAFGVDESVINRAGYVWSFSHLVFPHQLMRLMLAEQLYRACTIIRNEKYHHQ